MSKRQLVVHSTLNAHRAKANAYGLIERTKTALAAAARHADAVVTEQQAAFHLATTQAAAPALLAEAEGARLAHHVLEESLHAARERQRLAESAESAAIVARTAARQLALQEGKRHAGALALAQAEYGRAEKDKGDLRADYGAHIGKPPGFGQLFRTKTCQRGNARKERREASLDKARAHASGAYAQLLQHQLLESAKSNASDLLACKGQELAQRQAAAARGGVRQPRNRMPNQAV